MFSIAGAVVWAPLGAGLAALLPATLALVVGVVGVLAFGGAQLLSRGPARVPQRSWQVPRTWVDERGTWGRLAVWAATLGPGLMTRNPYVSYWVVVPALGSLVRVTDAILIGAVTGAAHGLARFGGIVARQRSRPGTDWNLLAVLWHMRFLRIDGALLLATGIAAVVALVLAFD
jgi:hypothetical protein